MLLIIQLPFECGKYLVLVSDKEMQYSLLQFHCSSSTIHVLPPLYCSLCIIYLMVAIGNWASVSVVAIVGPKISLIVTGFLYV